MRQPSRLQISDLSVFEQEITLEEAEEIVGGIKDKGSKDKSKNPPPPPPPPVVDPPCQPCSRIVK